jgi:hypothetical protein
MEATGQVAQLVEHRTENCNRTLKKPLVLQGKTQNYTPQPNRSKPLKNPCPFSLQV